MRRQTSDVLVKKSVSEGITLLTEVRVVTMTAGVYEGFFTESACHNILFYT